ncbi:MAG: aminoacyl-tRNA hydrolase [Kiritimatiellae bacterium]|nr:aminoacyl-tRNA hydrolase [Kiritimatiellia bacterium]
MKVVVGLGNPGPQYADTPHSVGFEAVDRIASAAGATWEAKRAFRCFMAKCVIEGQQVLLVKPQTFMNLSGESVAPVVRYNNATPADLVVVQDDIDLPVGRLRVRTGGSCGGHNGIRNIIERLGTGAFVRVKIGVGKDRGNVVGHVLGKFDPETRKVIDVVIEKAADAVGTVLRDGPERAMNAFNAFNAVPAPEG